MVICANMAYFEKIKMPLWQLSVLKKRKMVTLQGTHEEGARFCGAIPAFFVTFRNLPGRMLVDVVTIDLKVAREGPHGWKISTCHIRYVIGLLSRLNLKNMHITAFLSICLLMLPGTDPDPKEGSSTQTDPKDTYYKYEREEVSFYRDRVEFTKPPVPMAQSEIEAPPEVNPVTGQFEMGQKLVVEADPQLEVFIKKHKEINEQIKTVKGFRIQIYAGRGRTGREEARQARTQFLSNFPDETPPPVQYEPPLYRVRVGNFMRREDAELFCRKVREIFRGAFVVTDEVEVPKYTPESESSDWNNRN